MPCSDETSLPFGPSMGEDGVRSSIGDRHLRGRWHDRETRSWPGPGVRHGWPPATHIVPLSPGESPMKKWNLLNNSKVVRATASASTIVAVAVIVGAGYKWN
ncbi:hypothetical protein GCM10025876_19200 [Demequina litorisediminis]|uniref:Uncharacterized protein n=1 Tax=Demequina litorisediminis TaxID=1849022 RepID=A0ABQ6IEX4_9MICO|nr:hypothetical protein GCM10025876_19200 [Demequina litorisediminis]